MYNKVKMMTTIPFKRFVRQFNKCLMITIPKDLIISANVKPGQELQFHVDLDFPNKKEQSVTAPVQMQ